MIWHGRTSPAAHHGLVAGSSSAGPSPLKWPSPVHDLIARNVDFSLNNGPSATLRSCQLCAMSGHLAMQPRLSRSISGVGHRLSLATR